MNTDFMFVFVLLVISCTAVVFMVLETRIFSDKKEVKNVKIDKKHVNEESFQNYAKFYGNTIPRDKEFDDKLNIILSLINSKECNIKKIAEKSNCTLEECVLKIKYLKNKRLLGDYYVDTNNFVLLPCSEEDQRLLDKYKPYIYGSHLQVKEIANLVSNKGYKDIQELENEVFEELLYLDKKGLINGIKIDDVDRKIIYYTIEKRKIDSNYESIHCDNCGAINDVEVNGKVRCGYCNSIIKGSKYEENI